MNDFRTTAGLEALQTRADLLRKTRHFFDQRQFIEVQTPLLSADTVVDRHVDPVPILLPHDAFDDQSGRCMWLQTSPEFSMKRLLASGLHAIYQIGPAFRIGESGQQHNPEFTMLEWYRRGDAMATGIGLLSELVTELLDVSRAEVTSVRQAFENLVGLDPLELGCDELLKACVASEIAVPESVAADDWDSYFDLLFTALVQPKLGRCTPTIIHGYPASQAALATVDADDPRVANRFELFVEGVELANGYHELTDADELLRRNGIANAQRLADGKQALPVDSRLVAAMRSGLPECTGVALGFDRLVMVAVGATSIADVIAFPVNRA